MGVEVCWIPPRPNKNKNVMPEEMYPEAPAPTPSEEAPEAPEEGGEGDEGKSEGETVLVAKSALGGDCKMGEVYPMKVVGIYDDEVELARSKDESKEEGDEESGESKLDAMATPPEGE
jgi:hypothetical protein